jgi:alcohol dehydrogenase (NADP+)
MAAFDKECQFKEWAYTPRALGDHDIEISIECCGVCGSDIHTATSGWGEASYPCCVGHEIVGKVTLVGKSVKLHKVGDRVGVGAQVDACLESSCKNCSKGCDNLCSRKVFTYNSKYPDGFISKGGYADAIRVKEDYAFLIPESIESALAAPLLCAGVTVYSPLVDHGKKGDRVLVVGLGGLGHLAVAFGAAMGMEVSVLSHSPNKKDDAIKMGAKHFIDSHDKKAMADTTHAFDLVIVTQNADLDLTNLVNMVDTKGKLCLLAAPETPVKFSPFALFMNEASIVGSLIGSKSKISSMLEFAAKHKVVPWIEKFDMKNVNDAWAVVHSNKIRYRAVLVKSKDTFSSTATAAASK